MKYGVTGLGDERKGFVRKVYGILCLQLIITVGMCGLGFNQGYANFQYDQWWLLVVTCILTLAISIAMFCFRGLSRKVPTNYILLFAFTFCEAYIVSFACSQTDPTTVIAAASFTAFITICLTVYAMTTKTDFTLQMGSLFVIFPTLLVFGLVCLITMSFVMYMMWCAIGVLIYGFYLLIDTQLIIGGKFYSISMDDYILGAFILYIDIIVLFLQLLRMLSSKK